MRSHVGIDDTVRLRGRLGLEFLPPCLRGYPFGADLTAQLGGQETGHLGVRGHFGSGQNLKRGTRKSLWVEESGHGELGRIDTGDPRQEGLFRKAG